MRIYTTCPACRLILDVADHNFVTHPGCTKPYEADVDAYVRAVFKNDDAEAERLEQIINDVPRVDLPAAARYYAQAYGWPVFPLRPGAKIPATRNGFKDATTDVARIDAWWARNPDSNIGLPTGHAFDVIDIDTPHGWRSYWAMQDSNAIPEVHAISSTASGGLHLFIQPTGEGNRAGLLPGIDLRSTGGYIVAPPSVVAGSPYVYAHRPSPVITRKEATQ